MSIDNPGNRSALPTAEHYKTAKTATPFNGRETFGSPSKDVTPYYNHQSQTMGAGQSQKRSNSRRNANDLDTVMSASHKLEESLVNKNRPVLSIDGLVKFLKDEHYKRLGVYTNEPEKLLWFWRKYVSKLHA